MRKTPDNSEHMERPPAQSEVGRAGLERFLLAYAEAPADAELTLAVAHLEGAPDALVVVCAVSGVRFVLPLSRAPRLIESCVLAAIQSPHPAMSGIADLAERLANLLREYEAQCGATRH
jgi:hypothetical protein